MSGVLSNFESSNPYDLVGGSGFVDGHVTVEAPGSHFEASPSQVEKNAVQNVSCVHGTIDGPSWQSDYPVALVANAENKATSAPIKKLIALSKTGLLIDTESVVLETTPDCLDVVAGISGAAVRHGMFVLESPRSQMDLNIARKRLIADPNLKLVSVFLRDLDGWVADVITLANCQLTTRSTFVVTFSDTRKQQDRLIKLLSRDVQLTHKESLILKAVLEGKRNVDISHSFSITPAKVKVAIETIVRKFGVSGKSDLIRLFAQAASIVS